jgi:hypothetical protein
MKVRFSSDSQYIIVASKELEIINKDYNGDSKILSGHKDFIKDFIIDEDNFIYSAGSD